MNKLLDGVRVNNIRNRIGWTIADLAEKACLEVTHLGKLLKGTNNVKPETIDALCIALECNYDDIRSLSLKETYGITLTHEVTNTGLDPGIPRYDPNFHFTALFLLLPEYDGFLIDFTCSLFRFVTDPKYSDDRVELLSMNPQTRANGKAAAKKRLVARKYAWNKKPSLDVYTNNFENGYFLVNGKIAKLRSNQLSLETPLPLKKGELIRITYMRKCEAQIDSVDDESKEVSHDFLLHDQAHISCRLTTMVADGSEFDNLSRFRHEWLYWYTYGGVMSEGISPNVL